MDNRTGTLLEIEPDRTARYIKNMGARRVIWPSRGEVAIETFALPDVGAEEVLVATECTLISPGTERAFLLGLPNATGRYPSRPGYSNIGKITAIGSGVSGWQIGDRVASAQGHTSHFVSAPVRLLRLPDPEVRAEEAVFFNLGAIALQGIRKARLELGEPVLVLGQGLVGLLAVQLAALSGGFPVLAADLTDSRLRLSTDMGADRTLNPESPEFAEQLKAITDGKGPAVVIEATGHPDGISTALSVAGDGARVVLLASTRGETPKVNFYRDVHKKGLVIYGAHNSVRPRQESSPNFWTLQADSRLLLALITQKRFNVSRLISDRVAGEDAPAAYQRLMEWNPDLIGVVLHWNRSRSAD